MTPTRKLDFNDVMEKVFEIVGADGRFQLNFNLLFNCACLFVVAMVSQNVYFVLAIPKHWCHVPGRELANLSIDDWKALTIPRLELHYNYCIKTNNNYMNSCTENYNNKCVMFFLKEQSLTE